MRRRDFLSATVLAAVATNGAFAERALAESRHGGTLTAMALPEPATLLGAIDTSVPVFQVSSKIHNGLLSYSPLFEPRPELADSWTIAPDQLSTTFRLRRDVKWHDGQDFTSSDVAFTIMKVIKIFHPRGRSTFANVVAVETPDPFTAVFRLKAPIPYLLKIFSSAETPIIPKHIFEASADPRQNPHANAPIGTGPFKFVQWERGSYILLDRNPNYWAPGRPYLDKIAYRVIPDQGARQVALESGEVLLGSPNPVPFAQMSSILKQGTLAATTAGMKGFGNMAFLEFNLDDATLKDVRVRRAIAHGINRDFIIKNVYFGYGSAATGPVSPELKEFYTPDVAQYPYDPKQAEQILDEAGYKRKSGIRMSLTLDPAPWDIRFRETAEYIREALRPIGIQVELRNSDAASYLRRVYKARDFQLINYAIANMMDPTIGVERQYLSQSIGKGIPFTNASGYRNTVVDADLLAARSEADPKRRQKLWIQVQKQVMSDLPTFPLLNEDDLTVYNKKVRGLDSDLMGAYGTLADLWIG